eukprot:PhM_4_TR767/c0_g1_i1/m.35374/K15356/VRG4, GONST1; GDP-mannose transporter
MGRDDSSAAVHMSDDKKDDNNTSASAATAALSNPAVSAFVVALLQFTISSVGMMLGNKIALDPNYGGLPLPCTVVLIQVMSTLFMLGVFCGAHVWHIRRETVTAWFPISLLFALMLYTSLRSLLYATVSTVIILRNVGAIFTTIVEYWVRGVHVSRNIFLSEIVIVIGAFMYGWHTANFTPHGFFWVFLNVAAQVCYGVLLKYRMDAHPCIKDMTKYQMSLYNNALGLPLFALVWLMQGESAVLGEALERVTPVGSVIIASTCVIGFGISVSGFALQKLVSATTFLVINNLTKFLNILLGMMILKDRIVGVMDASGCLLALTAGAWYSYEQSRPAPRAAH